MVGRSSQRRALTYHHQLIARLHTDSVFCKQTKPCRLYRNAANHEATGRLLAVSAANAANAINVDIEAFDSIRSARVVVRRRCAGECGAASSTRDAVVAAGLAERHFARSAGVSRARRLAPLPSLVVAPSVVLLRFGSSSPPPPILLSDLCICIDDVLVF